VRGAALPWDLAAPCLGRPRHVDSLRLDQRLLDVCVGRIDPHPAHPALVRRYLAAPLLGLREVGAYALALAGLPVASPALEDLGLLAGDRPLPLPDEATILAVASQRGDPALSPEGWRRTAFGSVAEPPQAAPQGQALFFVPPDQIGRVIGAEIAGPITISMPPEASSTASGRPKSAEDKAPTGSHGAMESHGISPTTSALAIPEGGSGGGGELRSQQPDSQRDAPAIQPASESARLLHAVGVRRSVAAGLADRPADVVARVIAQARVRPDVRDLAGWVVAALRDLPAETPPDLPPARVSPSPILFHPDITGRERQIWLGRFRAADLADRQAILDRFFQEFGHGQSDIC
jgi:hypothetical protein